VCAGVCFAGEIDLYSVQVNCCIHFNVNCVCRIVDRLLPVSKLHGDMVMALSLIAMQLVCLCVCMRVFFLVFSLHIMNVTF
jgi:hypothetical protein